LSPFVRDPEAWDRAALIGGRLGFDVSSGMMAMAGEDYSTLDSIARTGGLRRDELWTEHRAHAAAVASLASEAGIGLVTFHAGFLPEGSGDPERGVLIDRLRTVADTFAAHGVRLGLETGQETAETLDRVLDELDRPNVGVNFDPANMILYSKGDPVAALERLAPRVVQVHVKDALPTDTPGTWGTEVPVGDGAVDWPRFVAVARAIEPAVEFVIEREAGADRTDDVRRAAEMIRSFDGDAS
jgi:sugar phosphate isomerase/epimerase